MHDLYLLTALRSLEPCVAHERVARLTPIGLLPCLQDRLNSKFEVSAADLLVKVARRSRRREVDRGVSSHAELNG